MKSVQIRSNFWSVFSCIRTEYGPEITPYLYTFHAVLCFIYKYMGQIIQEWTKKNLWETAFKKFEVIWSA